MSVDIPSSLINSTIQNEKMNLITKGYNNITLNNNSPAIAYFSCPEPILSQSITTKNNPSGSNQTVVVWQEDETVVKYNTKVTKNDYGLLNFHWAMRICNNTLSPSQELKISVKVYLHNPISNLYSTGYVLFADFELQHPILTTLENYTFNVSGIIGGDNLNTLTSGLLTNSESLPDLDLIIESCSTYTSNVNKTLISGSTTCGISISDCTNINDTSYLINSDLEINKEITTYPFTFNKTQTLPLGIYEVVSMLYLTKNDATNKINATDIMSSKIVISNYITKITAKIQDNSQIPTLNQYLMSKTLKDNITDLEYKIVIGDNIANHKCTISPILSITCPKDLISRPSYKKTFIIDYYNIKNSESTSIDVTNLIPFYSDSIELDLNLVKNMNKIPVKSVDIEVDDSWYPGNLIIILRTQKDIYNLEDGTITPGPLIEIDRISYPYPILPKYYVTVRLIGKVFLYSDDVTSSLINALFKDGGAFTLWLTSLDDNNAIILKSTKKSFTYHVAISPSLPNINTYIQSKVKVITKKDDIIIAESESSLISGL